MPLVTPRRIASIYTMLRAMPPFDRWKLPEARSIKFEVLDGAERHYGDFGLSNTGDRKIRIHHHMHSTLPSVVLTVAHEMVHLKQAMMGRLPSGVDPHNAEFRRMSHLVCTRLGWDVTYF